MDWDAGGVLLLSSRFEWPAGMAAHGLGHACTRRDDFLKRATHGAATGAWALELCADLYAYKWGFGRAVAASRAGRDWRFNLAAPGRAMTFPLVYNNVPVTVTARVTRHFYLRVVAVARDGVPIPLTAELRELAEVVILRQSWQGSELRTLSRRLARRLTSDEGKG
jgi:hypothetical protein